MHANVDGVIVYDLIPEQEDAREPCPKTDPTGCA